MSDMENIYKEWRVRARKLTLIQEYLEDSTGILLQDLLMNNFSRKDLDKLDKPGLSHSEKREILRDGFNKMEKEDLIEIISRNLPDVLDAGWQSYRSPNFEQDRSYQKLMRKIHLLSTKSKYCYWGYGKENNDE